jgi:hypothetical protein
MRLSFLGRQCMRIVIGSVVAIVAAADARADNIVVTNGGFTDYSGVTPGTNNDYFQNVDPAGWTGGGGLIFITNQAGVNNSSLYLPVYNTPPFPAPPLSSNFVEADGNPIYENSFSYQLSGLTVGKTYSLSFFQAAGQQQGFVGDTTNQWIVGLGTGGFSVNSIGGGFYSYSLNDPTGSVAVSALMSVPTGTYVPWEQETVSLTADNSNDLLTFLAWGDSGNSANLPPIAFLDIAGNGAAVPEPASLALIVIGMIGVGAYRLHRRRSNPTTV